MHTTRTFAALASLAGLACAALAQTPVAPAAPNEPAPTRTPTLSGPTNAALVYYRAWISADPKLGDAQVLFDHDPENDSSVTLTRDEAIQLLKDAQGVVGTVMRAASMDHTDFGLDFDQGWALLLPHLGKLRDSARLLAADARRLLADNEPDAAAARAAALYGMARQAPDDGVLISSLVGASIANLANTLVREMLDAETLTPEGRDLIVASIERIRRDDPFGIRSSIEMERLVTTEWVRTAFRGPDAGKKLVDSGFVETDPATRELLASLDEQQLNAETARVAEFYDHALRVWSYDDAVDRLEALSELIDSGAYGPLGKLFAPALQKCKNSDIKARAELGDITDALRAYRPEKDSPAEPAPGAQPAFSDR